MAQRFRFSQSLSALFGLADTLVGYLQLVPGSYAERWRNDAIADEPWEGDGIKKREMDLHYFIGNDRNNYLSVRVQVFLSETTENGEEWLGFQGQAQVGGFKITCLFNRAGEVEPQHIYGENPYSHLKGIESFVA